MSAENRQYKTIGRTINRRTTNLCQALLIITTMLVMTGCESEAEDPLARHFVIGKGEHYSNPRLVQMLQSDRLIFRATFNETAVYDFGDAALQTNKNKLLGFADCNSLHHENSARFAWQWFNGQLEIYAYCYVNSVRTEAFIGTVNLHEANLYELKMTDAWYIFYLNGKESTRIKRMNNCDEGFYYMLFPYFGGSIPAPHEMEIDVAIR